MQTDPNLMRKMLLIFALLLSSATAALCQAAVPNNIRATNTLDRLLDFDGLDTWDVLYTFPSDEKRVVVGDPYLNANWQKSTVLLSDDKLLEGYPVRYDIRSRELEVKSKYGIKVLEARRVKSYVSLDSLNNSPKYFINSTRFKDEKGNVTEGFFEVLSDGKLPLFKSVSLEVRPANYRPELNMGSREDKILKKEKYYYMQNQNIFEVPTSAKKLAPVFGDRSEEMQKFIKTNKLLLKEETHLKLVFDEFNKS